ncbi:MAG: hypothetical protein AVDCRST_MAG12-1057, partial [uncultured Rubrobacteraceae bacterium]
GRALGGALGARGRRTVRGARLLPAGDNRGAGQHRGGDPERVQPPLELPLQDNLRPQGHRAADGPPRPRGDPLEREPLPGGGGVGEHRRPSGADHRGRRAAGRRAV